MSEAKIYLRPESWLFPSLRLRMIGYNYLSKYNDWHDDFIISWHDKRIFLFEISKASDPTHARQGYNCRLRTRDFKW